MIATRREELISCALLTALALGTPPTALASAPVTAHADMVGDSRQTIGRADFVEISSGVLMTLQVSQLLPGVHALHVHETGRCDPPAFESAGGHFNPAGRSHGFQDPGGPHAGDLPNVYVPESGFLKAELRMPDVTLHPGPRSLLDADGAALVIHIGPDDYRTDPAGVSGSRVACGVITPNPPGSPDPMVVTDIKSMTLPLARPDDLAGRHVAFENVDVRGIASARAFWIGASAGEPLLVVADDEATRRAVEQLNLAAGRRVDIEGTVDVVTKATPDSRLTTDWGLSSRDADAVRRRGLFLRVGRITGSAR
jgi:superoxide dismutase, Cu-Zn family